MRYAYTSMIYGLLEMLAVRAVGTLEKNVEWLFLISAYLFYLVYYKMHLKFFTLCMPGVRINE